MSSLNINHTLSNFSLDLSNFGQKPLFNESSSGGVFPYVPPPPPGGGGMPQSFLFNNPLANAVQIVVIPFNLDFGPILHEAVKSMTSSFSKHSPLDFLSKSFDHLKNSPIVVRPQQMMVYMLRGASAGGPKVQRQSLTSAGYCKWGLFLPKVTSSAGERTWQSPSDGRRRTSYGFHVDNRLSAEIAFELFEYGEKSKPQRPQSGAMGFGEADSAKPTDPKIEVRIRTVKEFIDGLKDSESSASILIELGSWLSEDYLAQLEVFEAVEGRSDLPASSKRASLVKQLGLTHENAPDFYAAATALGLSIDNIISFREAFLGCLRKDDRSKLKELLEFSFDFKQFKLSPDELEGVSDLIDDLISDVIRRDVVAYYTKQIHEGGIPSKTHVFQELAKLERYEASMTKLQVIELTKRLEKVTKEIRTKRDQAIEALQNQERGPARAALVQERKEGASEEQIRHYSLPAAQAAQDEKMAQIHKGAAKELTSRAEALSKEYPKTVQDEVNR